MSQRDRGKPGEASPAAPGRAPEARLEDALLSARRRLQAAAIESPAREARLLLGEVLGLNEVQLLTSLKRHLGAAEAERFENLLKRRCRGEPVAYLLGEREFYGRSFQVDDRVLIPRPETEHLVEAALECLSSAADDSAPDDSAKTAPKVLDIGTGSGCIAVTLAAEHPVLRVVATDLSPAAAAVAAANARRHQVQDRVSLISADLDSQLPWSEFDLVVSNPPYIDPADASSLSPQVTAFEPATALFAPDRGLQVLHRLMDRAAEVDSCPLLVEIGFGQLPAMRLAAEARGLEVQRVISDYAGIPRTVILRRAVAPRPPFSPPSSPPL
ncbi:MAG: peptide chain release factor N(5)-glutamine methyltransferase [Acidobacteriota bacterium]